jgi:hypothetical protein
MTLEQIARLLSIRDALVAEDYHEAYHQLYMMADRGRNALNPWDEWETLTEPTYDPKSKL